MYSMLRDTEWRLSNYRSNVVWMFLQLLSACTNNPFWVRKLRSCEVYQVMKLRNPGGSKKFWPCEVV